jgi:hypothetical protein
MPSLLVQSLAPRVVLLESSVSKISISGSKGRMPQVSGFDFDVDLSEVSRTKEILEVEYCFRFGSRSHGNECEIGGRARLRIGSAGGESSMQDLGPGVTNEIVVGIFRRNYESVYLLHRSLGIEAPSPWITQDVSLARHSEGGSAAD